MKAFSTAVWLCCLCGAAWAQQGTFCELEEDCDPMAGEYCDFNLQECVSDSMAGGGTGGAPCASDEDCDLAAGEYCNLEIMECVSGSFDEAGSWTGVPCSDWTGNCTTGERTTDGKLVCGA